MKPKGFQQPIRVTVNDYRLSIQLERGYKNTHRILDLTYAAFYARQFVIAHYHPRGAYHYYLSGQQRAEVEAWIGLTADEMQALIHSDPMNITPYATFELVARKIVALKWASESWEVHLAWRLFNHSVVGLSARAAWEHILMVAESPLGMAPLEIEVVEGYRDAAHGDKNPLTSRVFVLHWHRVAKDEKPNPNTLDRENPYKWFLAPVAFVYVEPKEGESLNSILDQAWKLTEHDYVKPYHWPSRAGVRCLTDKPRSNMTGDVYFYEGEYYMVDWMGFARLYSDFPHYTVKDNPFYTLQTSKVESQKS